jgi:hypothetical protein
MSGSTYTIPLNAQEQELLHQIAFDVKTRTPYEERLAIFGRAGELTERLLERNAIPVHRLDWFRKPEHFIGGHGSSREQWFKRNAQPGTGIFRHPHFLKYLHYFIYGPDLPERVMSAFVAEVEDRGMITSGDILPLAKSARQQARTHGLDAKSACEEFYKLALEHGLDADDARTIRDQVRTAR